MIVLALPPRRLTLVPFADGTVPGILHVHTNRSDGRSGPDEIAAAAARAGLKFAVLTDHGDGTRTPDPPAYKSGVLVLDGVEISTNGGHYIAFGMPAAPYPLAGEARDVVEDVKRLGGIGIAAHPDSPKAQLQWREWDAPIDGVELLNPDTSWRRWADEAAARDEAPRYRWHARGRLAATLLTYPLRSPETIASLMLAGGEAGDRWADLATRRRVFTIGGVDAHAKLDLRAEPQDSGWSLPLPGYEASFRTLSVHVAVDRPLTGNAAADAAALLRAIREGHLYVAVDALATPAAFEITARNDRGTAREGDELAAGGPVTIEVRHNAPSSYTASVHSVGDVLASGRHDASFSVQAPPGPNVYWVEIRAANDAHQVGWLRSNAIYVRAPGPPEPSPTTRALAGERAIFTGDAAGWRAEHDPTSLAEVDVSPPDAGRELRFRYGLSGGTPGPQVAALAVDTPDGLAAHDRLAFTMRGDRPMRVSVQLRSTVGDRWQRSVYVDGTDRDYVVEFDDATPLGPTHGPHPAPAEIRAILFVVDVTNAKPGTSGRMWMKRASVAR